MTTGLLITTAGQAAIAADLGGGADLVLSHVAFGDSNGVPYTPNVAQVALVNERYRATIASVAVVDGAIVVDAVLPVDTPDGSARPSHGFNVAEAGLFSAAGTLIGVARMGNGYKAPPSSGQAQIATFRLKLAVANPSAITVVIDPQAQVNIGRNVRPFWLAVDGRLNAPPGAPAIGATYVIGAAPTGAWAGHANKLAQWLGVWALSTAPLGHVVADASKAESDPLRYLKLAVTGWVSAAAASDAYGFTRLATLAEAWARSSDSVAVSPAGLGDVLAELGFGDDGSTTAAPLLKSIDAVITTNNAIPNAAAAVLNFQTTTRDNLGTSTWNGQRLTIGGGEAGLWYIQAAWSFFTPADDRFAATQIRKNGTTIIGEGDYPYNKAGGGTIVQGHTIVPLAAGDYIEAMAYHQAGSTQPAYAEPRSRFFSALLSAY
ncbi:MAG: hypothetical protein DI527_07730 [Chelatococcus sp.]|nr:MAG: hypothetical protein DI527_07730 [Chelatococcus sp.]